MEKKWKCINANTFDLYPRFPARENNIFFLRKPSAGAFARPIIRKTAAR